VFKNDPRLAVVWVLPALRQDFDDAAKYLLERSGRLVQEFAHLVQAIQFLCPLLQSVEYGPELGFVRLHCFAPTALSRVFDKMIPRPVRPSTRSESDSAVRTWRMNSVSCMTGWRFSQSQLIPNWRP